jgi:5-formyltetrahydrofolate cyclo-ligase
VASAAELVPDAHGIPAPRPDAPLVPPRSIDLFLVPGLAFDRKGARLGQGGGYYDDLGRWLEAHGSGGRGGARLVGLGYDFQLVDACPAGERDVVLDALVTDQRVLRFAPYLDRSGGLVPA